MESRNISFKKLKYLLVLFVVIISMVMPSFASEVDPGGVETTPTTEETTPPVEETTPPVVEENLPYIEMKVKTVKVGETNQVLVECWLSKVTNFEGAEMVFTYDKTILQPSYINATEEHGANEVLAGLDDIKYEKRQEYLETGISTKTEKEFNQDSLDLLSNSFAFESDYADVLGIDVFRYLATDGNNEAIQFAITNKSITTTVSTTEEVLIGTFSFRQADETTVEEGVFNTARIKVICDDNPDAEDLSAYTKEEANGDNCADIMEFTYQKYGSISGTIETGYYNSKGEYTLCGTKRNPAQKTATIYLYNADDVASIDWNTTGRKYTTARKKIISFIAGTYSQR